MPSQFTHALPPIGGVVRSSAQSVTRKGNTVGTWVQVPPVWENRLRIAKFQGPRISLSEGLECVENTGFEGNIAFSPHELGRSGGT